MASDDTFGGYAQPVPPSFTTTSTNIVLNTSLLRIIVNNYLGIQVYAFQGQALEEVKFFRMLAREGMEVSLSYKQNTLKIELCLIQIQP